MARDDDVIRSDIDSLASSLSLVDRNEGGCYDCRDNPKEVSQQK